MQIDPYEMILIGSGYALDAVGSIKGIDLPRRGVEPDDIYRSRLISKWALLATPAMAESEYLDAWAIRNGAPPAEPKPNHVRDAVRANP